MTPGQVNKMLKGFYSGTYDRRNLPASYYTYFDNKLKRNVNEAFGSKAGYKELISDLAGSRQTFAAAKTYQLSRELQAAKRGSKTYDEYLEKALPIYERHETWGNTETVDAAANAQNAKQWAIIEQDAEDFPKLRYSAIVDTVTSDICLHLDGITLPVGHPLWRKYAPINHNRCRCTLIQLEKSARSSNASKVAAVDAKMNDLVDPIFKTNPGITKELFPVDHPYYTEIPQRDKAFARRNFDLPIK